VASRYLGHLAVEQGDHACAAARFREFADYDPGLVTLLARLAPDVACLAVANGEPARAARFLGTGKTLAEGTGVMAAWPERLAHERAEESARRALGSDAFAAAHEAGRRVPKDDFLVEVLAYLDGIAQSAPRSATTRSSSAELSGLTARELEVLRLVAQGKSNQEIAEALFISLPTVKSHLTAILGKLDLPSRSAATAYAHSHGLL
jgi:DNA-binding CsgD family transcriptional regulator